MGACRTAFDADLAVSNLTEQCDLRGAGGTTVSGVGVDSENAEIPAGNLTEQCDPSLTVQCESNRRKRTKGTGDTATTGKHNRRYKAYVKAVKSGKLKPSQYALVRHVHDGEKIGTETAQIWLEAMREDGVLREVVKNGKRAYELIT